MNPPGGLDSPIRRRSPSAHSRVTSLVVAWDLHPIFGRCLPAGDPEALLFRYSSLEQGAAVALRKSLLLSPLWAMNDPNEAAFQQVHPLTRSGSPTVRPRHIERDEWLPIREDLNRRRRNTRIASFTQDAFEGGDTTAARADSRGFARQTMWSHYAELGQGICLVFDRSKLMEAAMATWGRGAFVGGEVRYHAGFNEEFAEMSMIDAFHQLMGHADLVFEEAVERLAAADLRDDAERFSAEIVGRNVLDGRWTFQVVDEFDAVYWDHARAAVRALEDHHLGGRRHVFEAHLKERRRTPGQPAHEARPARF